MVKSVPEHSVDEDLARFVQRVDVGGVAVAGLRQLLHHRVVVIVAAETEHGEIDARVALAGDEILQRVGIGDADVEIAVGGQHARG